MSLTSSSFVKNHSMNAEDRRKSLCGMFRGPAQVTHRLPLHLCGKNHEMNIYKEELTEYKNRDAISLLTLFSEGTKRVKEFELEGSTIVLYKIIS